MSGHIRTSAEDTDPGRIQETKYGNLTYEEIRDRAAEGFIAIVPTGCTEQQGPHLPVDFDTWFAEQLMWAAAARARGEYGINALVLPALPFGPTPEHRNFGGGYIDIPKQVHHQMVWAILDSLVSQGFQRILIWRGCGGHDLEDLIERFNSERGTHVHLPEQPYHAIWCRLGDAAVPVGHADSFTTSICLYLRPEDVRMDKIIDPGEQSIDWNQSNLDFARHSKTGVIGDPRHATAELGERLWNATVQEATSTLLVVNQLPVEPNNIKSNQGTMTVDCLFCRIIAGIEPANIVYSDGDVVVFTPPNQESRVHLILASRSHLTSADALDEADAGLWMHLLQVARLLAREHGIDIEEEGYHLGTNPGRDATRKFPHLHVWLMNGSRE